MSDYLVTGEELTSVASAIRSKTLRTANLLFPDQFVSEINSITTGGEYQSKTVDAAATDVTVTPDTGKDALSEVKVNKVNISGVDATKLLSGQTITVTSGSTTIGSVSGSMTNRGAQTATLAINGTYTIPEGYHNGTGTVSQSVATKSAETYYTSTEDQTISSDLYLTGQQVIKAVTTTNLSSSNVKYGATVKVGDSEDNDRVASVTGTFSGSSTIVGSGKSAASGGDILTGKSAFLDGTQLDGTMVNNGALGTTITTLNGTYNIPAGYTSGGTVTATITSGSATTPATTITTNPTISWDSTNKKIKAEYSGSQSVTPTVSAGYVSSGTAGTVSTTGTASVTALSLDSNLTAANIAKDVTIFGVTGTHSGGVTPTGNIELQQKTGTDVTNYATASVKSGSLTAGAGVALLSGTNVTLSTTDNGISVSAVGKGVVTATEGWVDSEAVCSDEATSTKYISAVTVPSNKSFDITSSGTTTIAPGDSTDGNISVAAYDDTILSSYNLVVLNGQWNSTTVTYPTTAYTHYGKTVVPALNAYTGSIEIQPSSEDQTLATGGKYNANDIVVKATQSSTVTLSGSIDGTEVSDLRSLKPNILTDTSVFTKNSSGTHLTEVQGSMTNNGAVTQNITEQNGVYTIPAGYHNGSGTVKAVLPTRTLTKGAGILSLTGTNVTLSDTDNGIYIDGEGSGTVTVSSSGYIESGSQTSNILSDRKYISSVTVPVNKSFSVTSTGTTSVAPGNSTDGNIRVAAYDDGALSSYNDIVLNGEWVYHNITPTESELNGNYGLTDVGAISSTYVGSEVTRKAAATYYPQLGGTRVISNGTYLTGDQTILAVTTSGISADNIKYGATVKVGDADNTGRLKDVTGTFSGSGTVSSGQTAAAANEIVYGRSAFLDGAEIQGTMTDRSSEVIDTLSPGESKKLSGGYYNLNTISAYANAGTYTFPSGSTGATYDMAANNLVRYVNATNVYSTGYSAGQTSAQQGDATTANVLSGKTFTSASGINQEGEMADNGTLTGTITTQGGTYTIPGGYTNGGTVTATLPTTTRTASEGIATLSASSDYVTLSTTSNGIWVTATGSGNVSTGTGYITAGTTTSNPSEDLTRYITAITVPKTKTFNISTEANTTSDSGILYVINRANRTTNVTNASNGTLSIANVGYADILTSGTTHDETSTSSSGTIYVKAYSTSGSELDELLVAENGKWKNRTVTPSTEVQGPYYGETYVDGLESVTTTVSGGGLTLSGNSGGDLSGGTLTVAETTSSTSSNVTLSDTDNGISVSFTGKAEAERGDVTRAAFSNTVTRAAVTETNDSGYIASQSGVTKIASGSSTVSLAEGTLDGTTASQTKTLTKYITAITVPTTKAFSVTTANNSATDTSILTLTNGLNRVVNATNATGGVISVTNTGSVSVTSNSTTTGTVSVNAYSGSSLTGAKSIVSAGKWVHTDVTPSATAVTKYGEVTVEAITETSPSLTGGSPSIASSSTTATGSSITLSDTDTDPGTGIYITTGGSATPKRANVTYDGTQSGYYSKTDGAVALAESSASSAATLTTNKYYVTAVTLPASKTLTVTTTAISSVDWTNSLKVNNGGYRVVNITNNSGGVAYVSSNSGYTYVNSGTATNGTIYVKAYTGTTLDSEYKTVVNAGKWITNTVTPSTSAQGPYYGKTSVEAMASGALSAGAGSASMTGSNVSLSDTNNGISVTATGSGTVSVGTAGYLAKDTSKTSNNGTATKYISGIVVPASKTLTSVVLAAGTSSARTYLSQLTVNGYSTISNLSLAGTITEVNNNGGSITVKAGNTSSGTVSINAYDSDGSSLSGSQQIVYQNKWKTTTVTPSTSAQGPFYGKTSVNAITSFTVPADKSITITNNGTTNVTNNNSTTVQSGSETEGTLTVSAYDSTSSSSPSAYKTIVSDGVWNTNTPYTTTDNNTYYGKTIHYKTTTSNISAANIKHGVTVKVGDSADDDRVASVSGTFYNDGSTYTLSTVGSSVDMGSTSSNRYVKVTSLSVPKATALSVTTVANTSSDSAKLTVTNNAYRLVSITNAASATVDVTNNGTTNVTNNNSATVQSGSETEGTLTVSAYDSTSSSSPSAYKTIVEDGVWKTTTVTPSTSALGPFYGKVSVSAAGLNKKTVTLTPMGTSSTLTTFLLSDGSTLGLWRYVLYSVDSIGFTPSAMYWYAATQPLLQGVWIKDSSTIYYRYWSYCCRCGYYGSLQTWPLASGNAYILPAQNGENVVVTFIG